MSSLIEFELICEVILLYMTDLISVYLLALRTFGGFLIENEFSFLGSIFFFFIFVTDKLLVELFSFDVCRLKVILGGLDSSDSFLLEIGGVDLKLSRCDSS
mmetsp:Transcript_22519/g.34817  ORF Transcript_22519/g.34817 Transcript_22519/m.34817 type:complete len:101 (-) Transcript_22519:3059-3361(-)